jgi:parallel beta-helix repeat protein
MQDASGDPPRRPVTLIVSLTLWIALAAAFAAVVLHTTSSHHTTAGGPGGGSAIFSHVYPSDPFPFERPPVGTSSPYVPTSERLPTGASANSIATLNAISPPGTFEHVASNTWRLLRPLELGEGSTIALRGPIRLEIAHGAFLLAQHTSTLSITDVSVAGVTKSGAPDTTPASGRGFIDARSGANLELEADSFTNLGYLGDQTYGITIDGGGSASYLRDSTVTKDYFGIYIGRAQGVSVTGNRIIDSAIYGIDPHTDDSNLTVDGNTVVGSGVHGIVVAAHVDHSVISNNIVLNSRDHGIVLFQFADNNKISSNRVSGVFDGLVITDSSNNAVSDNTISSATRFGVRVSGSSSGNLLEHNAISRCLVGVYAYAGASGNTFAANDFKANYENVRIRSDAPNNVVSPDPGRSEL